MKTITKTITKTNPRMSLRTITKTNPRMNLRKLTKKLPKPSVMTMMTETTKTLQRVIVKPKKISMTMMQTR